MEQAQHKGVFESLLELGPKIIEMHERLVALESDAKRSRDSDGVTLERAAELITGEPYGSKNCITTQTVMKLVHQGHLRRVPYEHVRVPVIIVRNSIREYMGQIEPEY